MTYAPPAGWVEPSDTRDGLGENELGIFHLRQDCPRIRRPDRLRATDRPYTAYRCKGCAQAGH